jgi:DNA-nicking Smr family endonuclease
MKAGDPPVPRRGRRTLSAEERALWRGVARSIKPLRHRRDREAPDEEPDAIAAAPPRSPPPKARPVKPAAPARPAKPPGPPPLAPLARREKQKLVRGRAPIDARLDLHGMTQEEAHAALVHFLRRSQHAGARFVLVITGKGGRPGSGAGAGGVLRRQVPLWLGLAEFRDAVVGFEEAHMAHGGEGALYVRLRRGRSDD